MRIRSRNKMEIQKIKNTIIENYVHGAFNETNIEAFKTVFHPDFSIVNIQEDGRFFHFTRDLWENVLKERVHNKNFDYSTIAFTPKFRSIDIVENRASVSLDLTRNNTVIYTDFLLLVKIKDSWQIVSKVYHTH